MKTQSSPKLSVFISDNNEIYLSGLVHNINQFPNVNEIRTAGNTKEIMKLNDELYFQLFIIDIDMLEFNPISFIKKLKLKNITSKIIISSSIIDYGLIKKLFKQGATGFFNKFASKKAIFQAIESVLIGKYYASSELKIFISEDSIGTGNIFNLNSRDLEVIYLISHQLSNKEIAKQLGLSEKAIEYHRLNLYKSLGIKNMAGIGVYAVRNNIYYNNNFYKKFSNILKNQFLI